MGGGEGAFGGGDRSTVPSSAVLFVEGDEVAVGRGSGVEPGGLEGHEGGEPPGVGRRRRDLGELSTECDGFVAEDPASPVVVVGSVPFVVDEVDDFENGVEAVGELGWGGKFEAGAVLSKPVLGS